MDKLAGKVALISGSGRGIGRALALKLAGEGASVVVNDLDVAPALEVVSLIERAGGRAVACVGSVTDAEFAGRFVQQALSSFGTIDIIVNNAGYTHDALIQKMTDRQFEEMLEVHVIAPFRILRAAAEPIRALAKKELEEGREVFRKVVNISSIAGTNGNAGQLNYAAAKAGVIGMTKTLSKEWGRYRVCVNCVAFGWIDTRLTKSQDDLESRISVDGREIQVGMPAAARSVLANMIPIGRPGTPEEAAGSVYLFCIPESNYVSGQVLIVGGGVNL